MESADTTLARRDRLTAALTETAARRAAGGPLDGAALAGLTEAVLRVLPPGVRFDPVFRSLAALAGQPAPTDFRPLAWALAGRLPTLRSGNPVWPVSLTATAEDAALQVVTARRKPEFRKRRPAADESTRVTLSGRVLAGAGSGLIVSWDWTTRFIAYFATRPDGLGFAGRKLGAVGRPYQHYTTLVGTRFACKLAVGDRDQVAVTDVRCPGGMRDWNRALTEMRFRTTFACPFAFTHPCHRCPKGQESCPAAVRRLDLVPITCPVCGRTDHTDPDDQTAIGRCATCVASNRSVSEKTQ